MPYWLILILVLFILGVIWLIYQLGWGTPPFIRWAVERIALRMMFADPELITTLGLLENTLADFHSGGLTDASPRYMAYQRALDRDGWR